MTVSENDEISVTKDTHGGVPVIYGIDQMTSIERKLTKLFKCSFYRDRCFFTSNDPVSFIKHLESVHKGVNAHCIYCYYQSGESKSYGRNDGLVDHILTNHGFRNFQCNSCVYRGSSIPHVLLHQANLHGIKYKAALEGSIGSCKVLACKQVISGPLPSETVYWSNCRVDRVVTPQKESPKYQCLYCDFVSLVSHLVFFHICKVHPDYRLCIFDKYIDPLPEILEAEEKNTEPKDDEDAELDAIVHDLHSFGTKDDDNDNDNDNDIDIDMTPVDEPVDLAHSDDDTQKDKNDDPEHRERLFAQKGVRVGKKKPATSDIKKSTSKPDRSEPELNLDKDEEEEEEEEEEVYSARKNIMRGFRLEQGAALFAPKALTGSKPSARNLFKCTLCPDVAQLSKVAIENHLKIKHNTNSAFKCSECNFLGNIQAINGHFRSVHISSDSTVKAIKFIVAVDEKEEAIQTPMQSIAGTSGLGGKNKRKVNEKDPKNLSSKIKGSVFIGPKSWKKKQKLKEKALNQDIDSESETETVCGDPAPEPMAIDDEESQEPDERISRKTQRAKKKVSQRATRPVEVEELLVPKTARERDSEFYFCLFCTVFSSQNFEEAQLHMKRHLGLDKFNCPKCQTYEAETIKDLKFHCNSEHPFDNVMLPDENNIQTNYITEFLNEQFLRRRKGDQMNPDQAARYARIICPICERANQLTGDTDFHHTKWSSFLIHFWKHANATWIICKTCKALVPRTRKRAHLSAVHSDEILEDIDFMKDFTPYYQDNLATRAYNCLHGYKTKCKAFFEGRIKEEFEIEECAVILSTELNEAISRSKQEIKSEPS